MVRRITLGIGLAFVVALTASSAQAQFGAGGYGIGFYNYGNGGGINQPSIPYYALYPPVYYSFPVARTYGYSPFAYPPGVMTPDVIPNSGPIEFQNPYVPKAPEPVQPKPASDKVTTGPRTYQNPYVTHSRGASGDPIARRSAP
jgi:hypothetical protein